MAHMLFKKKFEGLQKDDNNQSQVGEVSLLLPVHNITSGLSETRSTKLTSWIKAN